MFKKILLILLLFAASVLGGALATVVFQPKEVCAGCVAIGGANTNSLDTTNEGSSAESTLISQGCVKLNNEDAKYGGDRWMACPTGYYMAAITDDQASAQDAFCCPFFL